jgi:DNA processing protein
MGLGAVVVEGAQYSALPITARLAMEFGREVFGVPGSATEEVSFGPNHQLIKQGVKLVTSREDVVAELPTPVRAELMPVESAFHVRVRYLTSSSKAWYASYLESNS